MKSVHLVCLVVFAILSVTVAKHLYEPRIRKGQDAEEGQFPYTVSLRSRGEYHYCGATILSARFLLTAAHCCRLGYAKPENVMAVVGALRQSVGGVRYDLDTITAHEKFNLETMKTSIYDVGILRTVKEIIFTNLIQPIALTKVDLPDDRPTQVITSGWGKTEVINHTLFQ